MSEEKIIREIEGGINPFRTPEGYFENFNERLKSRLPQAQPSHKTIRLMPRLWRYAAAVVAMVGIGSALYWNNNAAQSDDNELAQEEEYYNEALDYIMVGNTEIAEYLTEAY